MFSSVSLLAVTLAPWIGDYLVWWLAAIIVIGGLAIFGASEVLRLSLRRMWAISSVNFAESIRRRVLWLTPLAILGVIAVSELQHTRDPQEAIRQTIKYCLFASALLVTVTAVILACTNLPREIENRVIFTIVTKPTTRLELVIGKVLGFVRVSGLIVMLMGLFTLAYLELQNWELSRQISAMLDIEKDPSTRQTLVGYQSAGLLSTKSLQDAGNFQVFEHVPAQTGPQWITGGQGYEFVVPFEIDQRAKTAIGQATEETPRAQVAVFTTMHLTRNTPTTEDLKSIRDRRLPLEQSDQPGAPAIGPSLPTTQPTTRPAGRPIPQITVRIVDEDLNSMVAPNDINQGKAVNATPAPDGSYLMVAPLSPAAAAKILSRDRIQVEIIPETPSVEYEVAEKPTALIVVHPDGTGDAIQPAPDPQHPGQPAPPRFISNTNRYGLQVMGSSKGAGSVAAYWFRGVDVPGSDRGTVDFRFRAGVERSGDFDPSQMWSLVTLEIINRKTGESSGEIPFHPETNVDFPVPVGAKFVAGGDFDVHVRGKEDGQFLGLTRTSVQFISAEHTFVVNLLKSLSILWFLSILVVIIAIFTSTFLSWPIAVVLTLLILLGHWGVEQLGDALNPGVGRSIATDFGFRSDTQTTVVSSSVDALAKLLRGLSTVLPDVSRFPVIEDISRGVSIPPRSLLDSLAVLACYGLPLLVLSFVILKNKEVAP